MPPQIDEPGPTRSISSKRPKVRNRASGDTGESRGSGAPSPVGSTTPSGDMDSALEASAIGRMRILAGSMAVLSLLGVGVVFLLEGERRTKLLANGSVVVIASLFVFIGMWRLTRDKLDEPRTILLGAVPTCVAVVVANLAFGQLSPFGIAVAIGLLLFSSSTTRSVAMTSLVIVVGGYLLCAALVRAGLYPLKPLIEVPFPHGWMEELAVCVVALLYTAAFVAGRMIRREHARAVANFERAVREASMRGALLREAREAFRYAAGIGSPGRFTEQEIDGFKLGPVIGRGGMGEVYEATAPDGVRPAAVKLLRMDALVDRNALARFEREARIVAAIQSPHVVEVLGVSNADSVLPYLAMERLEGIDLAAFLRERGRMSLFEVADLVSQVAIGLGAAHTAKIVHRDLKPNNIFRTGSRGAPVWKILDFGVSKWMDRAEQTLTAAEIVGTPQYMAPEQARGEPLDQSADIYALSAIAYRALTGESPFLGRMPAILKRISEDMPRAPSSLVRLPEHVDYVLALGLAKERRERFQSAFELSAAFTMAAGSNLSQGLVARARELLQTTPFAS